MTKHNFSFALFCFTFALSSLFVGCGLPAGNAQRFDSPPGGTVIAQGTFATNASGIAATAQVYNTSGLVVLRLAGLSSPSNVYFVFLETASNQQFYVTQIQAQTGSINYTTGQSVGSNTFTRVVVRATTSIFDPELASAALTTLP